MSALNMSVDVFALIDRNATVAEVTLVDYCNPIAMVLGTSTGASKRENGDPYNPDIARDLAVGRALEKLGRQLRHRGEKAVRDAFSDTNG